MTPDVNAGKSGRTDYLFGLTVEMIRSRIAYASLA